MATEKELHEANEEIRRLKLDRRRRDDERLEEIQRNVAMIPAIAAKVEALDISVNGCDEEPEKGMKVRVDRLEQKEKSRSWFLGVLATVVVGLGIQTLWSKLTGRP